jgi:hypothetical protein
MDIGMSGNHQAHVIGGQRDHCFDQPGGDPALVGGHPFPDRRAYTAVGEGKMIDSIGEKKAVMPCGPAPVTEKICRFDDG